MVWTPKKKQQNKKVFSQLEHFEQDVIMADAMGSARQNAVVNNGLADWEFNVKNKNSSAVANENVVDVETLKRNFSCRSTKEMSNVVETVEAIIDRNE